MAVHFATAICAHSSSALHQAACLWQRSQCWVHSRPCGWSIASACLVFTCPYVVGRCGFALGPHRLSHSKAPELSAESSPCFLATIQQHCWAFGAIRGWCAVALCYDTSTARGSFCSFCQMNSPACQCCSLSRVLPNMLVCWCWLLPIAKEAIRLTTGTCNKPGIAKLLVIFPSMSFLAALL